MRDNTENRAMIIFSVSTNTCNTDFDTENAKSTQSAMRIMMDNDINFKRLVGSYNDAMEVSFLVGEKHLGVIVKLSRAFLQDSILLLDSSRNAKLLFMDTLEEEELGAFKQVSALYAKSKDSWTYDNRTNQYWITE